MTIERKQHLHLVETRDTAIFVVKIRKLQIDVTEYIHILDPSGMVTIHVVLDQNLPQSLPTLGNSFWWSGFHTLPLFLAVVS